MRIAWTLVVGAIAAAVFWYSAGPSAGYLYGVEFGCSDNSWRLGAGQTCAKFEWQRTIYYRVDVANNRVVILLGEGDWHSSGSSELSSCGVYTRDTWRCKAGDAVQTATDGRYTRGGGYGNYTQFGSTRLIDVARYLVGAAPPDPTNWR